MSEQPIRLTGTSFAVLSLLQMLGEATPYDLKQALERSIENFWPVPHTTFYAEPERLAKAGLLAERREPGGRRRRLYSLTEAGGAALHEWRESPILAPPQLRDEGVLKLFAGGDPAHYLRARHAFYKDKLAELDAYLDACPDEERYRGVRASLIAGTTYNRLMLESIEGFMRDQQAAGAAGAPGVRAPGVRATGEGAGADQAASAGS
jgi:DNA-binding PadR family transcriptional regulator